MNRFTGQVQRMAAIANNQVKTLLPGKMMVRLLMMLGLCLGVGKSWGQVVFSGANGASNCVSGTSGTWVTSNNWCGGVLPTSTQIAQFGANGTNATISCNMGSLTTVQKTIGAIEISNANSLARTITNSSSSVAGSMVLMGTTVNSIPNVILRNNSSTLLTVNNGSGSGLFGFSLGNTTDNIIVIDGTGSITINPVIKDSTLGAKNLTKSGSGTGVLTLAGVNTYTGNTTISAGTLALSGSGSISASPNITVGSGGTFDVTGLTTALTLGAGQTLKLSSTGSNTTGTITVSSAKGITLSAGGLAFTTYGGGATAPLTVNGTTAGALALNSAPITVTTTSILAVGTYTLIAKGGSATGVTGTPGTLTVNGSGTAGTNSLSVVGGQLILTVTSSGTTPPTLSAAGSATVDAPFNVTFADDAAWRAAITSITVGGTTLTAGYSVSAGQITFTPSASAPASLLQTPGSKSIVVFATGYGNATVAQTIGAGAANKLEITTQPTAPASNGAALATQPVVAIRDQYGNATTSTASVSAAVGAGSWTIGGTISKNGVSGIATFTDLTATSSAAVTGATINFTSAGLTGATSNTFNIPAPPAAITLSSSNPAVVAGNITQSTTNNVIYAFQLSNDVNSQTGSFTGLSITTAGSYLAANITNLKAWIQTTPTFTGSGTVMSTLTSPGAAGSKTFPSFAAQSILAGETKYIFITGDFTCTTIGNTISVNAVTTSNLTFSSGTKTGTAFNGDVQTFIAAVPNNVTSLAASTNNQQSSVSWTNPAGCYTEIMIVAAPASVTATPTGDGSGYSDNLVYGSGTSIGNGFVVYKGTTSSQIITGLTNGNTYFFKVFARNGTNWSSGVEVSVVPALVYCTPTYSSSGPNDYVSQVTLGTLSQATASNISPYYIDYTTTQNAIPDLTQTGTYSLSLTFGNDANQYNGVWLDFNNDGTFATSEFFSSNTNAGSNGTVSVSIVVPGGATLGNIRMRIRGGDDSQPLSSQACGASASNFGQAQDYLVNITANVLPVLTTTAISGITYNSATSGGNISTDNGSAVTERGIVYGISPSPTTSNTKVIDGGTGIGSFTSNLTGLADNTLYYVRAYAINANGTSYGNELSFSTSSITAPTAIAASTNTHNSFIANWNAVPGAANYKLDVSTTNTFTPAIATTLAAWTFPTSGTTVTPDVASANNISQTLTTTASGGIGSTAGATTQAATCNTSPAWQNGSGTKYWQVDVNTTGYTNITVSSKQRSSSSGPRDFKLQYKVGVGVFTDVAGGAVTTADNFTSGVLSNVSLPAACDNQASVSLRWIMTSNTSVGNGTVASTGSSRIDDISVVSTSVSDILPAYDNLSVAGTSQSVTGLTANTTYYYRVRAVGANSTSSNSGIISVLTYKDPATSDYRTTTTGNFNNNGTWEYNYTGTSYQPATQVPGSNNNVTVQNGHTLTMDQDFTVGSGRTFTMQATSGLVVAPNKTFAVAGSANFAAQSVIVQSDITGSGIIGNISGTLTGATNVTVERFIGSATPKAAWRLLTAPLRSTTANNGLIFDYWQNGGVNTTGIGTLVTGPGGASGTTGIDAWTVRPSMQYFDHTVDQNLHGVTDTKSTGTTTPLFTTAGSAANKSYFIFTRGDRSVNPGDPSNNTTFRPVGTLQTGDQTFATATGAANDNTLVGNPYAAPVDLALFRAANLNSNAKTNYYYWDPYLDGVYGFGGYVTVSYDGSGNELISPSGGSHTRFLQSGQAMFLERKADVSGTVASVTFKENQKGSTNAPIFLLPNGRPDSMAVNLDVLVNNAPILVDGIIASFDDSYNATVDDYDASKFNNIGESVSFKRSGKILAIERRPLPGSHDTLYLNMANMKAGNSYRFDFAAGFSNPMLTAFLQDSYVPGSNYPINLITGSSFDFAVTADAATAAANRFRIVFAAAGPLAVSFKTVKAYEQNHNINVEWKVENESDMQQYEVEKSTNGTGFTKVNTTAALNQSSVTYTWTDVNPVEGYNFYRIRSIANSGEIKYSTIVKVLVGKTAPGISIYPNPIENNTVNLQMKGMPAGTYTIRLINATGQVIQTLQLKHAAGNSTESLPLSNQLGKGAYILEIIKPDNSKTSIQLMN